MQQQVFEGYRGYGVSGHGELMGAQMTWKTRRLIAECHQDNDRWTGGWNGRYRDDEAVDKLRQARAKRHMKQRAKNDCHCGIHGSWKPYGSSLHKGAVIARCVFFGDLEFADHGLRATGARIQTLYVKPRQLDNKELFALAWRYQVKVIVLTSEEQGTKLPSLEPNWEAFEEKQTYAERVVQARALKGWQRADVCLKVHKELQTSTECCEWWSLDRGSHYERIYYRVSTIEQGKDNQRDLEVQKIRSIIETLLGVRDE